MEFFKSKIMKKFYATLLTIVFVFSLSAPYSAIAQTGTLGTEFPVIKAVFTNSTDDICDGNLLETGEYNIQLVLSGMSTVSLFQIIANTTDDITINSYSTIADTNDEFSVALIENEDNKFSAVIISENEDSTTVVSSSGEVMISLNVTVNTAGDFENYFVVSTNPNSTYVEADYGDGIEKCYVHVSNTATDIHYNNLTFDMSPDLTVSAFNVTGKITIATDVAGTLGNTGIVGITASLVVDGETKTATSNDDGYYTLTGIPEGEYSVTFSGTTTVDRNATLTVSADRAVDGVITVDAMPINVCDYVDNEKVDAFDYLQFNKVMNGTYDTNYDIVKNEKVDAFDYLQFNKFLGEDIVNGYEDVVL